MDKIHNFYVKRALFSLIVALIVLIGWLVWRGYSERQIDSFAECAARYPVMETYPEQCRANGETFVAPTR